MSIHGFAPTTDYIGFIWDTASNSEIECPVVGFAWEQGESGLSVEPVLAVEDRCVSPGNISDVNDCYEFSGIKRVSDSVSSFWDRL